MSLSSPFSEQLEWLQRGAAEIVPEKDFHQKLQESLNAKKPLRVKLGIDPTAPDIHLGHSVVLRKLRQFQTYGHRVILIIGDFTAKVGDPTGRSEVRKVLSDEEIQENTKTYLSQIGKILDTRDKERFELRYNSEWLAPLDFQKIIELAHHFTVAQLLEREDFSNRYKGGKPVGLHEFFYPIMQGYDSIAIKADVELGGTDQKFNILAGRELQRIYGFSSPQIALLMPILPGLDGVQKMSKSLGNHIGITDAPQEMFGKAMSSPDSLMPAYFELLTDLPKAEIGKAQENPREWKARLGEMIVEYYHGADAARKARENFDRVFREKKAPEEMPEFTVSPEFFQNGQVFMTKLLVAAQAAPSMREAKRLLRQGGVEIDGRKISEETGVRIQDGAVLQAGKKRFIRLRVS